MIRENGSDGVVPWSRTAAGGLFVLIILATYYWIFFLPPMSVGSTDPDRYFHLGLSQLISEHGLLRVLPQVEDLGWGRYFPDKEFLFHVLTGTAHSLGGSPCVLAVVPLTGILIALLLHSELCRVIRPLAAAVLTSSVFVLTAAFLFRLSLLRPHILAILFFCLLISAVIRSRPRLAAMAAAGFVLAYHAFYIVLLVAAVAWLLRRQPGFENLRLWLWIVGGLVVGTILNPYFPSNVEMGLLTLRLALGVDPLPATEQGRELMALPWQRLFMIYGFIPASLFATAVAWWFRRPPVGPGVSRFLFLALLSLGFWVLGAKSPRAMEYAVPASILMIGYGAFVLQIRWWVPLNIGLLVLIQGFSAQQYYRENIRLPPGVHGSFPVFASVLGQIPAAAAGKKVFNCEWEAGSYVLYTRPDLRFVDLLEPALLWNESSEKFLVRRGLIEGAFADPRLVLRGVFNADYVLCGSPALIKQMQQKPKDFTSLPGTQGDKVRLFAVRPE